MLRERGDAFLCWYVPTLIQNIILLFAQKQNLFSNSNSKYKLFNIVLCYFLSTLIQNKRCLNQ